MKILFNIITQLKGLILLSHRVTEMEKEMASLRKALETNDLNDVEQGSNLDRRLLRLEHFFEFANRYLQKR